MDPARSRPHAYGTARSPRRCTTTVGARTARAAARTSRSGRRARAGPPPSRRARTPADRARIAAALVVSVADEDVGEHPRPQTPVRRTRRSAPRARRTARSTPVGVRPVQQQPIYPLWIPRRERDRRHPPDEPPTREARLEAELVHDGAQQLDLVVECHAATDRPRGPTSRPRMVVADQCVARRGRPPEGPERLVAPVQLEVAHPPRGRDQRRPVTADRERDPRASELQNTDRRPRLGHPPED